MAVLSAEIGYHLVGLTFDADVSKESRQRVTRLFEDRGIETVSRIDLQPRHRNELLTSLRKVRSSYDIVAVECHVKQLTAVAFRDRRVDLVFFPPDRRKSRFSYLIPERLKKPVEFNAADLLDDALTLGSRLQRGNDLMWNARRRRIPVVASSGATNWSSMRAPRDIAAILCVLGLDSLKALDAVSLVPFSMATENTEKRGPRFVSDGTRIVR